MLEQIWLDNPIHFGQALATLVERLRNTWPVHTGEWQAQDTSANKLAATYELMDVTVHTGDMNASPEEMRKYISPNLPWADLHFAERVGGEPVNPPPSHKLWPWSKYNSNHQDEEEKFSHTYPERMWPRWAAIDPRYNNLRSALGKEMSSMRGLRFRYGDLNDVLQLLIDRPLTRQAYLPIWFPEDTGAVEHQRVPCTLGYHFMIRDNKLSMRYYLRSCDLIRHFPDDYYLAARLMYWMHECINEAWDREQNESSVTPGSMTMYISSLHAFVGDKAKLESM
jgi:hypothetical protein